MITRKRVNPYQEWDERCLGYVDYNEFRVYRKSTNVVYETKAIASKATGVPLKRIEIDLGTTAKEWNRIGYAFRDRKYDYYQCEENFEAVGRHARKPANTCLKNKNEKLHVESENVSENPF